MQFKDLFKLKYEVPPKVVTMLEILGILLFFLAWQIASLFCSDAILPSPLKVMACFPEMLEGTSSMQGRDRLLPNLLYSIGINYMSYLKSAFYAIVIGFPLGQVPIFKHLSNRLVNSFRFIPLSAVTGLFIAWYGIEGLMRVNFLTFAIFVYLLPVIVQRVAAVDDIYLQTAHTMGASYWQKVRYVILPHVLSKVFEDFIVLIAMSWTYIIIVEMINASQGVGFLIFTASRASRLDMVFALLIIIVVYGFVQDKIFKWVDKKLFPAKYS